MTGSAPLLRTDGLSVHFGDRSAIADVNLSLAPGERVSLVGPNGAGKSTLLKSLAGVLQPSHGTIWLEGERLRGPDPRVVYVPQRSAVDWSFPYRVLDVVLMARRSARSRFLPYGEEDRRLAMEALQAVGMDDRADVQIGKLSGGQQQRMFIARALLQTGDLYLLDEPFTGVDIPTQELVVSLLGELANEGKSILFATHDLDLAEGADRTALLNRELVAVGPPAETLSAENLKRLFGQARLVAS